MQFTYTNPNPSSTIKTFSCSRSSHPNQPDTFTVKVVPDSNRQYQRILEALVEAGFSEQSVKDRCFNDIRLIEIQQPDAFIRFIQVLMQLEPSMISIKEEIESTLTVDLSHQVLLPTWVTMFHNRCNEFYNLTPNKSFDMIVVGKLLTGLYYVDVHGLSEDHKVTVRNNINNHGNSAISISENADSPNLYIKCCLTEQVMTIIELLTQTLTEIEEIKQSIFQRISAFPNANESNILRAYVPRYFYEIPLEPSYRSSASALQLPTIASRINIRPNTANVEPIAVLENEKTCDKYGIKKIPEKYLCAIGSSIMTDPVFDPKLPKIKFERAAIERHLDNSRTNPFNRQPLTKAELKADAKLQRAITLFIERKRCGYTQADQLMLSEANTFLAHFSGQCRSRKRQAPSLKTYDNIDDHKNQKRHRSHR